ncbi:MAG: C40 family peptidase [Cytophagaceae bacterium]|jgi:cell wall-associated NlpC family hydrolase|nr:C40 family peptidase [Cytophagaceae bacterium]
MRYVLGLAFIVLLAACHRRSSTSTKSPEKNTSTKSSTKTEKKSSESTQARTVIKEARTFMGTPYKYGGNTRAGIDCSGLMCQSFKSAGITLPRTAQDQAAFGKSVPVKDIRVGDLVFFTDKKGNSKITHVGLVTEVRGEGQVKFIHASTKAGVIEADLFSDYYKGIFLKAVRVL